MATPENIELTDAQRHAMAHGMLWPGSERANLERAIGILHNMALERRGWRRIFGRWLISDEPLRNDAARFLKDLGVERRVPIYARVYDPDPNER